MENLNFKSESLYVTYLGEGLNRECAVKDENCDNHSFLIGIDLGDLNKIFNNGEVDVSCSKHLYFLVEITLDVMIQLNEIIPTVNNYGERQVESAQEYLQEIEKRLYMGV